MFSRKLRTIYKLVAGDAKHVMSLRIWALGIHNLGPPDSGRRIEA